MIEDDIEQARHDADEIDISDSPDFIRDVANGTLGIYKDKNNVCYLNFASVDMAEKLRGEEGKKYFKMMKKEIKKNDAKKLNEAETSELVRKLQAEKIYRYRYFG